MTAGGPLIEAIADAVALRVEQMAGRKQCLLDIDQAAEYLGMSAMGFRHKVRILIPIVKIDSKLRFDKRDLDTYIDRAPRQGVSLAEPPEILPSFA